MVKSYLRYSLRSTQGVVASPVHQVALDTEGKLAICAALENVIVWNPRQGTIVRALKADENKAEVTSLALSPATTGARLAVGYSDGRIRIWDYSKGECLVTFQGHKSSVSCLRYNATGSMLASGSNDTDVVVWDSVAESGLFRFRSHTDLISDLCFLSQAGRNHLVSSSKDGLLKVWELDTQYCCQTIVGAKGAVWSIDADPAEQFLVAGTADQVCSVYSIQATAASAGVDVELLKSIGTLARRSRKRVVRLRFNAKGTMLGVQSRDKVLELFRLRAPAEARKKCRKRTGPRWRRLRKSLHWGCPAMMWPSLIRASSAPTWSLPRPRALL